MEVVEADRQRRVAEIAEQKEAGTCLVVSFAVGIWLTQTCPQRSSPRPSAGVVVDTTVTMVMAARAGALLADIRQTKGEHFYTFSSPRFLPLFNAPVSCGSETAVYIGACSFVDSWISNKPASTTGSFSRVFVKEYIHLVELWSNILYSIQQILACNICLLFRVTTLCSCHVLSFPTGLLV